MRRPQILVFGVLALATTALAQQDLRQRLRLKSPVKYAGIYHYATRTWTRPGAIASQADLGPTFSTIYNNTNSSPYFAAWYPGEYWTDEGRIPSQSSPDKIFSESQAATGAGFVGSVDECPWGPSSAPGSARGSANTYSIAGFQIGFCSQAVGSTTSIDIEFRQTTEVDGLRCAEERSTSGAPQGSFNLTGLPGNGGSFYSCWVVAIDVSSTPFNMLADGTGNYLSPPRSSELAHLFSWSFTFPTDPGPVGSGASGFLFAGCPANQTPSGPNQPLSGVVNSNGWLVYDTAGHPGIAHSGYDGTVWDKHGSNLAPSMFNGGNNGSRGTFAFVSTHPGVGHEEGTGMSTQDCVRIDNPTSNPMGLPNGSYWFGGPTVGAQNSFTSFHLELYTADNTVFTSPPGTGFCYGDGCAFTCPCTVGTIPDPQGHHESGCANGPSFGTNIGSILRTSGSANPFVGENVRLDCNIDFASPLQAPFALGVKGNARLENGAFPALNDGARCVDGGLIRFGGHNAGANGSPAGAWHYPTTAPTETVPLSIRTASSNGQTTWFQVLHRNTPNSFCFSDSLAGSNWSNGMIIKWGAP